MTPRDPDMYDKMQSSSWNGTQPDTYSNTSNMKPVYPPCDKPTQRQFAESLTDAQFGGENYIPAQFDRWNNVVPESRPFAEENATAQEGTPGDRQFASNRADLQSTGYGENMGLNEIPYGQGAAFDRSQSTIVSVDRADRGRES